MTIITGMVIGLVLLGLIVILLFFGIAQRVFKSFGIAYWLAFIMVGTLIGCAFIPSFSVRGVVFNVAGFIAPVVFAAVFWAFAVKVREGGHAAVSTSVVAAVYIAAELLTAPVAGETVTVITEGFLCGAAAYLVGRTKLSALASVFAGFTIGDIVTSVVAVYVYGEKLRFGSAAMFDAVILAAVFSIVLFEAISAIKRSVNSKRGIAAETAEEFDPDEYKKYFDE